MTKSRRKGFGLGSIVLLFITSILTYSGYWYYVAYYMDDYVKDFIKAERGKGLNFTYDELEVKGFPYRFNLHFQNPVLTFEQGPYRINWQSITADLFIQPWNLSHGIFLTKSGDVSFGKKEDAQKIITLIPDASRTSIRFVEGKLYQLSSAFDKATLVTQSGDTYTSDTMGLHFRIADNAPTMKPMEANDLVEPKIADLALVLNAFGKDGQADKGNIELILTPRGKVIPNFNPDTLEDWRNQGGTIDLSALKILWQGEEILTDGSFTLDENYTALGAMTAKTSNANALTSLLESLNWATRSEANEINAWVAQWGANNRDEAGKLNIPVMIQGGVVSVANTSIGRLNPVIKP